MAWPLVPGRIDVWSASLAPPPLSLVELQDVLSDDERSRADRFRLPPLRERYTAARGLLRVLLAGYVGSPPEALRFRYGPYGKPFLEGPPAHEELRFSLSHSGSAALFALSSDSNLGVDLEAVRPVSALIDLARRFLSAAESATLQALPGDEQLLAFFRCWSRKEAYLKATGGGVAAHFKSFDVPVGPDLGAHDVEAPGEGRDLASWRIRDLEVEGGYVAALAAPAGDLDVRQRIWEPGHRPGRGKPEPER